LDGSDRGFLLATFRELLDLPDGVPDEQAADSNRSMTAAEAELLRSLNEVSADWDWPTYQRTIRTGAATGMVEGRRPDPRETPIVTPAEVLARVAAHGREVAGEVARLGVVVHGDLAVLGQGVPASPPGADEGTGAPADVPISAAVSCVLGAIAGAQRQAAEAAAAAQRAAASSGSATGVPGAGTPTTRELAAELSLRIRRGTRRRLTPRRSRSLPPDGPTRP
jgi:hypothetical protein